MTKENKKNTLKSKFYDRATQLRKMKILFN